MSLFPSQMRRLLESCVNDRAAFKRGNTVFVICQERRDLFGYFYTQNHRT